MRLETGQYFGETRREERRGGMLLTLSTYRPDSEQPWHVHAEPTLFVLLCGELLACPGSGDHLQAALTTVFHPTCVRHTSRVGPKGMLGLNLALTPEYLMRSGLAVGELGDYRILDSGFCRRAALRLAAAWFHPEEASAGADLE